MNTRRTAFALLLTAGLLAGCGSSESPRTAPSEALPACHPQPAPEPRNLEYQALAERVADAWIARHSPASMHWDWGPAVLTWALLDLHEATGEARFRDYVATWVDHHADSFPMIWSDTVAPAAAAVRLAQRDCNPRWLQVLARTDDYLRAVPRTQAGGIGHLGILQPAMPQLWVDSLFMVGSYWMSRAALFGETDSVDAFAEQIRIFADELQDPATGLFRHALVQESHWPWNEVFWGRGNGWVASIVGRFLETLPAGHPDYAAVRAVETRLLEGLLATQDASGLWWTVINAPGEGYLETSASALFAEGLLQGARLGLVDTTRAEAAFERARDAVIARIDDPDGEPVVTGTSGPTQPGGLNYYATLPVGDDIHYGVGAVLLMLLAR